MSPLCFTYKSEYLQIKQSSGTGFRLLCTLRLYLHFLDSLYFSSACLLHVHFECFRLLARCENFDIDFETVFNDSFKRYGLVFDTFAAELAWVCLPCVCVRALLAGHSERLQFVRHTDMILSLKPSDTPSAEVERLMNDVHWTLRDSNFIWLFSILPSSGH